jgi:hypothetical protein
VLLGTWGISYVRDCIAVMSAPGVPVEFPLRTPEGLMVLRATSYSVGFRRGVVLVTRPRLFDPTGRLLASAEQLTVSGLELARGADQSIRVSIFDLYGRLTRLKSGRFQIQNLIPPRVGKPAQIPYFVEVQKARFDVIDQSGPRPYTLSADSDAIRVAGVTDDWTASGSFRVANVGQASAVIHRAVSYGYRVGLTTSGLQLASFIAHLKEIPEGRKLAAANASVESAVLKGPVSVLVSNRGAVSVRTQSMLELRRLEVGAYRADLVTFQGAIGDAGVVGHFDAQAARAAGTFDGAVRWLGKIDAGGRFTVHAPSPGGLPDFIRRRLPKGLSFAGTEAQGWATYTDPHRYLIQGRMDAGSAAWRDQAANTIDALFLVDPDRAVASLRSARWTGQSVSGGLQISMHDRKIFGGVLAHTVDLGAIASRYGRRDISGNAAVAAVVEGAANQPRLTFRALGSVKYQVKGVRLDPLQFEVGGAYSNDALQISRAYLAGREGNAFATGSVKPNRTIDFQVASRQLRLDSMFDHVAGQLNLEASVTGSVNSPRATGRAEVYAVDVQGHQIPLLTTDFAADKSSATFMHARAIQGATQADGSGRYLFATRHFSAHGSVSGVQISDYLGEKYIGAVDIANAEIVGSVNAPLFSGDIAGDSLVLNGIKVDHIQVRASGDRNGVTLDSGIARLADGVVTATGDYDFGTKEAHLKAEATPLNLGDFTDRFAPDSSMAGTIAGTATLDLDGTEIRSAKANGRLAGVSIGGTAIGDGAWTITGAGKKLKGSLEVGRIDRFVAVHDVQLDYAPENPVVSGDADLYNLSVSDLADIGAKYFPNLSYDWFNTVKSLAGSLSASIQFNGEVRDPEIDVKSLSASSLQVQGEPLGTLEARFERKDREWNVESFRLSDGHSTLAFSGKVAEQGSIQLDGDLSQLELSHLGVVDSRLAGMTGNVSAAFSVEGETARPRIRASVSARGLFGDPTSKDEDRSLRVELAPVTISESETLPGGKSSGGIQIAGNYFYRGFVGKLTGDAPFRYPPEIPDDRAVEGHLTVEKRDLKDIAAILGGIDAKRTAGTVGGSIDVSGTAQKIRLTGDVDLLASVFAVDGMDDPLQDFHLNVSLQGEDVILKASGKSSLGGAVSASLTSHAGDLSAAVSKVSSEGVDALLGDSLNGSLTFDGLKLKQSFPQRTYVQGTLNGNIALGGTLRRPTVTGSTNISDLESVVPTLAPNDSEVATPIVNPQFNLALRLDNTAHVSASSAQLNLTGAGTIKGSLSEPQVDAALTVQKGELKLPTSTVRIEDGGTVQLTYHATRGNTLSRLDVDLTGLTQVIAPGAGDSIQRYDVTLGVKGDLLTADGLHLTAESDPPDLTQDRILGLLGQSDALESMNAGSGVSRGEAQRQIQGALAGFAVPSLASNFTASIARTLGLDYLELGFNAYQDASFTFAKTLGTEFTFQASRGLSQPPPGYPFQFDYRLILHPRQFKGILRRFSLFLGTDQDNPYKFGLIYGVRF